MEIINNKKLQDDHSFPDSHDSGQSIYTGDENNEIIRIRRQNEYLNEVVAPYLDDVFSHFEDPFVLDIGCADGSNILLRLKGRKFHSLLGIDRNQHKIDAANSMYNNEKTMFLCADINKDLFSTLTEYLNAHNKDGFDIIHISSVLLHIEDPDVLLNNLKNFLSENGRLFIQDEDDGMNIVFPFEKSFEDCFYVWDHSIESGDRFMGRKIPYYLSESNYSDIKVYSTAITSADFNGKKKDCLWDLYFNCDLWVADDESYYDNAEGYKRYRAYKENYAELKKAYMNGQYFIMLGILFISAKK